MLLFCLADAILGFFLIIYWVYFTVTMPIETAIGSFVGGFMILLAWMMFDYFRKDFGKYREDKNGQTKTP